VYALKGLGSLFPTATPAQTVAYCSAGRLNWLTSAHCWDRSLDEWQRGALASVAAAPGAPPVDAWTVPPADGDTAQATVDEILNLQLREQQRLNAAGVDSSIAWRAASAVENAGSAIGDAASAAVETLTSWKLWAVLGVAGVAVMVAIGGGSPRRYGR
jgi:hypothetical protein